MEPLKIAAALGFRRHRYDPACGIHEFTRLTRRTGVFIGADAKP
jgi:hypothetical protein